MLSNQEVLAQSRAAVKQWGDLWEKHAKINGERYKADGHTYRDFMYKGLGKTLLCIGLAPSFERYIDIVKQYRDNVDIAIVDKALGPALDHGIIPDMVFLSDAVVSYEDWCEPWVDKTENITLISNITANPKWQQNWKGPVYFTVNKDNIQTEQIYGPLSGCYDIIPASSNVGNTIVVFTTQLMAYDEYLLLGYDFTFNDNETYYAFKESDKRYWMKHGVTIDSSGNMGYITQNLLFTCRWLADFYKADLIPRNIKLINCSGGTILQVPIGNLERKMRHAKKRPLTDDGKKTFLDAHAVEHKIPANPEAHKQLNEALTEHKYIGEVTIKYYRPEDIAWLTQRCA